MVDKLLIKIVTGIYWWLRKWHSIVIFTGDFLPVNHDYLSVISVEKCIGLMVDTTRGSLNMVCTLGEIF